MRWSFSNPFRRAAIIGLCLILLTGCGAVRLSYNQGPQLARWWLDGYLDFTGDQSPRVGQALGQWFSWHRETQLGDYASVLAQARSEAGGPLTAAQVCRWNDQVRARIAPALERALPLAAEVVPTLTEAQLTYLEQRLAKTNEKARKEYLQSDPVERLDAAVKRVVDRFASFYGPLDDAQSRLVAVTVAASPFDAPAWMAEREQRQRDLLSTLRQIAAERPPPLRTQALLRTVARRFDGSPRPATKAADERLSRFHCELVASVHNTMSSTQRKRLHDKLAGWEDDLRQLAAESSAAPSQAGLLR